MYVRKLTNIYTHTYVQPNKCIDMHLYIYMRMNKPTYITPTCIYLHAYRRILSTPHAAGLFVRVPVVVESRNRKMPSSGREEYAFSTSFFRNHNFEECCGKDGEVALVDGSWRLQCMQRRPSSLFVRVFGEKVCV